jgi:hypothetical protein
MSNVGPNFRDSSRLLPQVRYPLPRQEVTICHVSWPTS